MQLQAYQGFSVAVILATFFLVEMPSHAEKIRADIDSVLKDLQSHSVSVDERRWVPLVSDGHRAIRQLLAIYDARKRNAIDDWPRTI